MFSGAFGCFVRKHRAEISNVSFTPCQQDGLKSSDILKSKSNSLSDKVDVKFADNSVQITYYNFAVTCDFTTVDVTHTFVNGVLNITQQGSPNEARCICYTDVSYTINGISQNEVNVIFINGVQVYCYNDKDDSTKNSLVGKWSVTPSYNSIVEITENNINFVMGINETWSYKWISNNLIEIARHNNDTTRNEVIFHTRDSVTIKGFYPSDITIYPPEYYDVVLTRIKEDVVNPSNCDPNVIIDEKEYFNVPEFRGNISNIRIEGNNLKFTITASRCSGSSWIVKLITTGAIETSLPPQRTLQLSFENKETCAAVVSREFSFNIECLQVENYNQIQLNIAGNGILYEYGNEDNPVNCDQDVIVSQTEYNNAPNHPVTILNTNIEDNCLKIKFGASGCSGDNWVVKLIDSEIVTESNPSQRTLRLSLNDIGECEASFEKEISFNIEDLQIKGNRSVQLNISGKSILYGY